MLTHEKLAGVFMGLVASSIPLPMPPGAAGWPLMLMLWLWPWLDAEEGVKGVKLGERGSELELVPGGLAKYLERGDMDVDREGIVKG